MTTKKPAKWDALIHSFAEFLRREPQTVVLPDGRRVFGFMVEPWSEVRAEIRRLQALQVEQEAA